MDKLDLTDMLDNLKSQNETMFKEFFEFNCIGMSQDYIKGKRVLDIGSNLGFFSLKCRSWGSEEVLAVEPEPGNFSTLAKNTSGHGIVPLHCAVMPSGTRSVNMIESEGVAKTVPGTDVPARSLSELLGWFPPEDNDIVLKIDVEGLEYDIILDAPGKDLRRFKTIYLETHQTPHLKDMPARKARFLESYMSLMGFEIDSSRKIYYWEHGDDGKITKYQEIPNQESWVLRRIN